jgi:hypothetical protein
VQVSRTATGGRGKTGQESFTSRTNHGAGADSLANQDLFGEKIMKTLLLAAAASLAFAGVASAQTPDSATIIINGDNPAKCGVISSPASVNLAADQISDADGFANPALGQAVANALTGAGTPVAVYCTGASNGVVLGRTSLRTGDGTPVNGFNRAVVYDIAMSIEGATRADNVTPLEGSSDGGNGGVTGPGSPTGAGNDVSSFGASPSGAAVSWFAEGNNAFATTSNSSAYDATGSYAPSENRLAAGTYSGTVQITLTPRV